MKRLIAFLKAEEQGQAMLEYALVTVLVVIFALAPYANWTRPGETESTASLIKGYTTQCKDAVNFISLPCP